jgi:ketosteroid isomerase-like protein
MGGLQDRPSGSSAHAEALIRVAERYVGAYQDRDLAAMLAVMDENVVSFPTSLFDGKWLSAWAIVVRVRA